MSREGTAGVPLTQVCYAKSPEHERFLLHFGGTSYGRYFLSYLVGIEIMAGSEVRAQIERERGLPKYFPNEKYPAVQLVALFDAAVRAGVPMYRLGELQVPTFKRAKPWAFKNRSIPDGLLGFEASHRKESGKGAVWAVLGQEPGTAQVFRQNQAHPCEFFAGVVSGLFKAYGGTGTARETACQWQGASACCVDARWTDGPSPES